MSEEKPETKRERISLVAIIIPFIVTTFFGIHPKYGEEEDTILTSSVP